MQSGLLENFQRKRETSGVVKQEYCLWGWQSIRNRGLKFRNRGNKGKESGNERLIAQDVRGSFLWSSPIICRMVTHVDQLFLISFLLHSISDCSCSAVFALRNLRFLRFLKTANNVSDIYLIIALEISSSLRDFGELKPPGFKESS